MNETILKLITMLIENSGKTEKNKNEGEQESLSNYIGKMVIVRTYSAGVVYGELEYLRDTYASVRNARQIYRWEGALTLIDLANTGGETCKLSSISEMPIELTQVISIIPITTRALKKLNGYVDYESD